MVSLLARAMYHCRSEFVVLSGQAGLALPVDICLSTLGRRCIATVGVYSGGGGDSCICGFVAMATWLGPARIVCPGLLRRCAVSAAWIFQRIFFPLLIRFGPLSISGQHWSSGARRR